MKVVTLMGSPRSKGNTARVLGWVEAELTVNGQEVERINVVDYDIHGCLGCGTCQKNLDEPGCVQKDDVVGIQEKLMAVDTVIFATPLYCWGFTSQMKALIDRQFCLVKGSGTPAYKSLVEGKKTVLLVTCAGPVEDNADVIQVMFDRENAFARCTSLGKYVIPFCTTPEKLGPEAKTTAVEIAKRIVSS